ncbi:MAG: ribbon-helix-helix protein, CopG family [Cetobacterium sp.]
MTYKAKKTILAGGLHTSIRLNKMVKDLLDKEQKLTGKTRTSLIEEAVVRILGSKGVN